MTVTAVRESNSMVASSSRPSIVAINKETRSDFSRGKMACVSGSPKRQLNSSTRNPLLVTIKPGKSRPRNMSPLLVRPWSNGCMIESSNSRSRSVFQLSAGLTAPMPPVFGPSSPSSARLWSRAVASVRKASPLTNA